MFKKILGLLAGPARPDARALYHEYRATLEEKVMPLGFTKTKDEDYQIGAVLTYSKQSLEIGLVLDVREGECVFRAESGNVRKWVDENGHVITEIFDVYLPLADSEETRTKFLEELDKWLSEHNAYR